MDFALARYNPDGSLDTGFGNNGKVTTKIFDGNDYAEAVAIQRDGRIVVAGRAAPSSGTMDFAICRYDPDGTLDPSFGNSGKVVIDASFPAGLSDAAPGLAIQPDGKILVTGRNGADRFGLVRLHNDGSLDTGFGASGKVSTDFEPAFDSPEAIATTAGRCSRDCAPSHSAARPGIKVES